MSQWDKLLEKLNRLSSDVRFEELEKILSRYGYKKSQSRTGSSHYIFRKGDVKIVIPRHRPILKVYVALVRSIVEEEEKK